MKSKQAFYSVLGNFVYLLAVWALTVVVVRFSTDFYAAGLLSLAMTISNVFYVVACYGMRAFQVSDINQEYSDQCYVLSRILSISAALIACVVFIIIKGYNAVSFYCILIYMIYKCLEAASDVIYGVFQKNDDFEHICLSMCVKGVFSIAVFTVALMLGASLPIAIWCMVAVAVLTLVLIDIRICVRYMSPLLTFGKTILKRAGKLLLVSLPAMIVLLTQPLLMSIPRLFFERNFSTELLGIYSSVSSPTVVISTFVSCAITPYIPLFAEYYMQGEKKKLMKLTYGSILFAAGFGAIALLLGTFLGDWALSLLYGNAIRGYVDIFQLVIIVTTCCAIVLCLDSLYIAMRKLVPLAVILLAGCLLCYFVTPFFVTKFAMRGVTYALLIALAFQIIVAIILAQIYFGKMMRADREGLSGAAKEKEL